VIHASRPVLAVTPAFAAKQNVYPPIPGTHPRLANLSDTLFEGGLSGTTRLVVIGRGVHPEHVRISAYDRSERFAEKEDRRIPDPICRHS
jgi:hypothetical protein